MLRAVALCLMILCPVFVACGGDPVPTATEPQAPNQTARTKDQKIDYLIKMLHRKTSENKNAQAAREPVRLGAAAEPFSPELPRAIEQTKAKNGRSDAEVAITGIETALEAAQ